MPATTIEQQLTALHAHYTSQVNAALAAGRLDLARDLAEDCRDEALELMLTEHDAATDPAQVEILELGGLPPCPRGRPGPRRSRFWWPLTGR